MEKIKDFLEKYEDLWHKIDKLDPILPCGDQCLDIIDENDYYGCNFEANPVYRFFFTGQSNYFPAICNIKDMDKIDEYPVYIFDIASNKPCEYVGNFRFYITSLLNNFLRNPKNISKKYITEANNALKDVGIFSKKINEKNISYNLIIND